MSKQHTASQSDGWGVKRQAAAAERWARRDTYLLSLLDANLWAAAERIGDILGTSAGLQTWESRQATRKSAADLR